MPQFFFHIREGSTLIRDEEGSHFEDLYSAFSEARESARDLAVEQIRGGQLVDETVVELTDPNGTILLTVPLRSVLPFR